MKWIWVGLVIGLVVGVGGWRVRRQNRPVETNKKESVSEGRNPFGVMLANAGLVNAAKSLGVVYYRPISVFVDRWEGGCGECEAVMKTGLKLVLTVRNNGGPRQPTTPPSDLGVYRMELGKILERYKPEVLVVENEENSQALFYAGTSQQYLAQLKVACEVARAKGIKCTNGGLVSSLVVLLTAQDYAARGESGKANDFLKRAVREKLESEYGIKNADIEQVLALPKAKLQLERGKELVEGYAGTGADFVNFHWYVRDTTALEEAVEYLQRKTGLTAVSNEMGQQKSADPAWVSSVMGKIVELELPVAVWFSVDVGGFGEAKSLVNPDGSLRPNGQAFADFVAGL